MTDSSDAPGNPQPISSPEEPTTLSEPLRPFKVEPEPVNLASSVFAHGHLDKTIFVENRKGWTSLGPRNVDFLVRENFGGGGQYPCLEVGQQPCIQCVS